MLRSLSASARGNCDSYAQLSAEVWVLFAAALMSQLALYVISLRRKTWSLLGVKRTLTNRFSPISIYEHAAPSYLLAASPSDDPRS
jgi:hypothetical protein